MVILDATILLHLLFDDVDASIDATTSLPVSKCRERIDYLLSNLSESRTQVLIPTPVLAEVLVCAGPKRAAILAKLTSSYAFRIQPFDEMAAVDCADLIDGALTTKRRTKQSEAKAKIKFDRQIIAIAKVAGVKTIFSDDEGLAKCARKNGIQVTRMCDLPLPPVPPQAELAFAIPEGSADPASATPPA
jgi:predicted nucleic acid-binding protein